MAYSISSASGRLVLTLEGTVTIKHAQNLAASLGSDMEDGVPLRVETKALEDIDTCAFCSCFVPVRKSSPDGSVRRARGNLPSCGGSLRTAA